MNQIQSLVLGAFILTAPDGSTVVLSDGTTRGNPVPIETAVQTWLQDGAIAVTQGHDNREVLIRVRFFGTNLTALATTEARLVAELEKPNTLTWTPANGQPASVFEVVTSSLERDDNDDVGEGQAAPWRTYVVRLVCKSFVHSASERLTAALPASGTTTTSVNDGSATTNWTATINGVTASPSVVSGAVGVTSSATTSPTTISLTYTAAITTSSTKIIWVDWKPANSAQLVSLRAYGDGTELALIATQPSPTSGYTRTWYYVSAASIAALRLDGYSELYGVVPSVGEARSLFVDQVSRTDVRPNSGSSKQLQRSLSIVGSAPAPGCIAIEHETSALGDVLLYCYQDTSDGYIPVLRQYRSSGPGETVDATMASGKREDIKAGTFTADIPLSRLMTGLHTLMVRLSGPAITPVTLSLAWSFQVRINATNVGTAVSGSSTVTITTANYGFYALTQQTLPPLDVDPQSTTAVLRVTLLATVTSGSMTNVYLDDGYLFNMDKGQLVGPIACGTASPASGGAANRMWVESPTVKVPRNTLRIGFASDRSDSFYPAGSVGGWQFPQFKPATSAALVTSVFTVTTNANDAQVSFRAYDWYHSNSAT